MCAFKCTWTCSIARQERIRGRLFDAGIDPKQPGARPACGPGPGSSPLCVLRSFWYVFWNRLWCSGFPLFGFRLWLWPPRRSFFNLFYLFFHFGLSFYHFLELRLYLRFKRNIQCGCLGHFSLFCQYLFIPGSWWASSASFRWGILSHLFIFQIYYFSIHR